MFSQVARVIYPALPSHPAHAHVKKLFGGQAGGVVSFELQGGAAAAEALFKVTMVVLDYCSTT